MHSEGKAGRGPQDGPDTVIAGRYRLLRQLGRGGMGVVWEALDTSLDRKVAVKGLLYPGAASPEAQANWVSRARREAQAIARIGHQNVVAVHDVIEDGNQVWIVMELLNSRSLADLLREQQQLSVPHAARIGLQVLRGLAAVHESGVLHRDVKPHNVLFRPDGRALLMDFGIATFEGAAQVTRSHEIIGTPQYLAPELLSHTPANPRPASAASDLWALGVTLYEMVEGRRPFDGGGSFEILIAVRESPLPPMRYAGPLTALIGALLEKDPARRPDAAEAERMLRAVTQDVAALDTPAARPKPPEPEPQEPSSPQEPPKPSEPEAPESAPRRSTAGTASAGPVGTAGARVVEPGAPAGTGTPAGRGRRERWKVPAAVLCTALLVGGGLFAWGEWGGSASEAEGAGTDKGAAVAGGTKAPRFSDTHDELRIGVKKDQPGLSVQVGDGYKGFEVDLGREIGRSLGFDDDKVKFSTVNSGNRSERLAAGRIDLVLASYSISEQREAEDGVKFAGPYFEALKGLLVRKGRPYNDLGDLQDTPTADVCTARESVYVPWIKKEGLEDQMVLRAGYEDCVKLLLDPGSAVYAVATDDVIVAGLADKYAEKTKALDSIGDPDGPGVEGYGVAMAEEETGLHREVCQALSTLMGESAGKTSRWAEIYSRHLEPVMGQSAPKKPGLTSC
ncbi:serine/threonine protein kinase [Streptomyces nitrosporeus]|uniref:non-specific serine/threonine protein kinase n=3 Tax=Streptomyces nitrosporeus TaxID=28894 RepID=A0A5J6FFK2_9ACTN|nr:serine/threonine-protein kinase [Streptomyces nitrosporeus]QEU74726.1 serine/threonine protein kinase [Streptomyces nitrosporeus]GGY85465.1 serine/threonine protein kinase [Streptomyces nitrosporeus]